MKKRLLTMAFAVACAVGAYAVNVGDYIYSASAKYKITGENLVTNGAFNVGDGTEGWTNEFGDALDGTVWGVQTNVGPNGENAIASLGASTEEGTTLANLWQLSAGLYTISYYAKAATALNTTIAAGSANYLNFFTNETGDGTITTAVAESVSISEEWQQIVVTVETTGDVYLVLNVNNMASETMLTGFEIHAATQVYDSRIAERFIANVEKVMGEPDFAAGAETVLGPLQALKESLAANAEDEGTISDLINQIDEIYKSALDDMAGTLAGTYLSNWDNFTTYYNWNNVTTLGTYTFEGGRWGISPNTDYVDESSAAPLERAFGDGNVASAGIQTGYTLDVGVRITANTLSGTSMGAGRYMFSLEAQAVSALNKAAPYGSNNGVAIVGPTMWVGNEGDPYTFENDTLNGYYWKHYYRIVDIPAGTDVAAGFHFPVIENKGGRYSVRNVQLRRIGMTTAEVGNLYAFDQLSIQQNALKARLDSAAMINAYTIADGYPWGHEVLNDSIAKYTDLYNQIPAALSNPTLEFKDEVLQGVRNMNSAISNYYKTNNYYTTLKSDIAVCTTSLNDPENAAGDKASFKAVIDEAQALVDATTATEQTEEFDAMDNKLLNAKEEFEKSTATRNHPASIRLVNPNFEAWNSKSTYSSDTEVNGWSFTIGTDGKQWDVNVNSAFVHGAASIWRGTTVGPNGKAQQKVTVSTPGVYEYRAKAYATDDTWAQYMGIAKIVGEDFDPVTFVAAPLDTIYHPNVRLFFGQDGAPDSITLSKCAPVTLEYTRYTPMEYAIFFVKSGSDEVTLEFGFESYDNGATAGANAFGFGDNQVNYVGNEEAYKAATQEALNAEVAFAKEVIAKYGTSDENVGWMVWKLMRLVGDPNYMWAEGYSYEAPTTIKDMQNTYISLREYELMLATIAGDQDIIESMGVKPAFADEVAAAAAAKGVYNILGMKMSGNVKNLNRGLYIVNGKKILVK